MTSPPPTIDSWLRAGCATNVGRSRSANEDRCYADVNHGVFLICDGIGGQSGGGEASHLAVEAIPPAVVEAMDRSAESTRPNEAAVMRAITDACDAAIVAMADAARADPRLRHMGTTMAMAVVTPGMLHVAHVEYCRAYQIRHANIKRLTTDETLVQGLVDSGLLDAEESRTHPWRHVVSNLLGPSGRSLPLHTSRLDWGVGDYLILTTDGVHDGLTDEQIRDVAAHHGTVQEAAEELIREAMASGSTDNVSAVVVKCVALPGHGVRVS